MMTNKVFLSLVWFCILSINLEAQQDKLRELADRKGFYIGAAVGEAFWNMETNYRETLAREYNILVAENEMKFERIEPSRNNFNWEETDELIAFAEANNMMVRGHTLIWHSQSDWVSNLQANREEMIEIMRNHIHQVVGRYKGRVWQWDVVNEGITEHGLRQSFWQQKIGDDFIELAFQFAHEADPDALLFYNDYQAEYMGAKSNAQYKFLEKMLEKGVPIHGVGLQCHFDNDFFLADQMRQNIKRLTDLGLKVAITELDFRIHMPAEEEDLLLQRKNYREIVQICLEDPNCTCLLSWGFTDKHSWIPSHYKGWGASLPFDENYQPKPSYYGIWEGFHGQLKVHFNMSDSIVCPGDTVELAMLTEAADTAFWVLDGWESSDSIINIAKNTAGTYFVGLVAANQIQQDTLYKSISIKGQAHPDFLMSGSLNDPYSGEENNSIVFKVADDIGTYDSIYWDFGDGGSSELLEVDHTYTAPGSYNVKLTVYNSCQDASVEKEVIIEHGDDNQVNINPEGENEDINIFPNPFSESAIISTKGKIQLHKIEILDFSGKVIYVRNKIQSDIIEFENYGLKPGIYFVRLIGTGKQYMRKIIII